MISLQVTATGELTSETTVVSEPFEDYEIMIVPSGIETALSVENHPVVSWLWSATNYRYKVSVCTGALLLVVAGFADDRRVTTHPSAYDALAKHATVTKRRVVQDGDVISGGSVSSALDIGLYVEELLIDAETRERIVIQRDYPYYQNRVISTQVLRRHLGHERLPSDVV